MINDRYNLLSCHTKNQENRTFLWQYCSGIGFPYWERSILGKETKRRGFPTREPYTWNKEHSFLPASFYPWSLSISIAKARAPPAAMEGFVCLSSIRPLSRSSNHPEITENEETLRKSDKIQRACCFTKGAEWGEAEEEDERRERWRERERKRERKRFSIPSLTALSLSLSCSLARAKTDKRSSNSIRFPFALLLSGRS